MRKRAHRELDWYAIRILRSVKFWSERRGGGDEEAAMAECMVIGALFAEATCIASWAGTTSRGGQAAEFSDKRREQRNNHQQLLEEATKWREKRANWSASQVARRLPGNQGTARKAIASLWRRTEK
jgi:hypothetical protein